MKKGLLQLAGWERSRLFDLTVSHPSAKPLAATVGKAHESTALILQTPNPKGNCNDDVIGFFVF